VIVEYTFVAGRMQTVRMILNTFTTDGTTQVGRKKTSLYECLRRRIVITAGDDQI